MGRTLLVTTAAIASAFVACASFSASDRAPPPPVDAGVKAGDAAGSACDEPVVVAPGTAPEMSCAGDGLTLDNDPRNCGACGHSCFDARCTGGLCEPEILGKPAVAMLLDGRTLYLAREGEVTRVALDQRGAAEAPFVDNLVGSIRSITGGGPEIYVSTGSQQYVVDTRNKALGPNPWIDSVSGATPDGLYFPGVAWSHYVFGPAPEQQRIARIAAGGGVELSPPGALGAFAAHGDALFWTAADAGGSGIFGPFERTEPIFRSSSLVHVLAADHEHAYFADDESGKLLRVGLRAPSTPKPIAEETGRFLALAVNGADVFYAADRIEPLVQHYVVVRVSSCGGAPVVLIDDRDPIRSVAADAEYVYALTETRTIRARR